MKRVMVISPHPDDETIGCGGTILAHVAAGDVVYAEILTSGENGGHGLEKNETAKVREAEAIKAAAMLGIQSVEFYRQPDSNLRAITSVVNKLTNRILDFDPDTIYVPHPAEQHPDHRAAFHLLQRCLRSLNARTLPRVLAYEIWTPLQQLDEIIDITPHLQSKLKAIAVYKSQTQAMNFEAAAQGLARYRGEMHCWPGGEYAEVFADVNEVIYGSMQVQ
jgi:LmbE family N-acetylglucosaminyl deacetylase